MPRSPAVRAGLFAGGFVALYIAGKVAFLGLGAGTFHITLWELVPLVVVGAALIVIGWQRSTGPSTDLEDGLSEGIDTEDEP